MTSDANFSRPLSAELQTLVSENAELVRMNKALEAITSLPNMIGSDPAAIGQFILERIIHFTRSRYGFLALVTWQGSRFRLSPLACEVGIDCRIENATDILAHTDSVLLREVLQTGRPLRINDLRENQKCTSLPAGHVPLNRLLLAPTREISGPDLLLLLADKETPYDAIDESLAERLAMTALHFIRHRMERLELIKAKKQAEKAGGIQKEFLSLMNQEMRTPLNSIMGMLQLLLYTDLDPEQKEYVETAYDSSKVLLAHISDILDLSQLFSGNFSPQSQGFDISEMGPGPLDSFRSSSQSKGIRLSLEIEPGLNTNVLGDPLRLRQILFNLMDNAVKFTHRGGVGIQISQLHPDALAEDRIRILFIIADTGVGIEEEKLQLVEQAFTQADASYSRRYQGLGVGLTLVKRLMEFMGGSMSIESEPGEGTTVFFSMEFQRASEKEEAEPVLTSKARLNILVAEDDKLNRLTTVRLLEQAGHQAEGCENGYLALKLLAEKKFDAVLMDVQMPGLDGVETTKRIRNDSLPGVARNIPILALTAHTAPEGRKFFLSAGMDGFLAKPVEQAELDSVIRQTLDKRSGDGFATP